MNIAFNDISEECALELVHLVHSYHPLASMKQEVYDAIPDSVRTCPPKIKEEILIPFAKKKKEFRDYYRGGRNHISCSLVNVKSGEQHDFVSIRDALRFLGIRNGGMARKFAEQMIIGEWKFCFED